MLSAIAMPLAAAVLFFAFGSYWLGHAGELREAVLPNALLRLLPKDGKVTKAAFLRLTAVIAVAEVLFFLLLWAVVQFGMQAGEGGLSDIALLITAAVPYAAVFFGCLQPERSALIRLMGKLSAALALLLMGEVLIANAVSFTAHPMETVLTGIETGEEDKVERTGEEYCITGDATFTLTEIPEGTHALLLRMDQEKDPGARLVHIWAEMEDENTQYNYIPVDDRFTMAWRRDPVLRIDPYGSVYSLLLRFGSVAKPVTLHEIVALSAVPFRFSLLRWGVLALTAFLVLAAVEFRLCKKTFTDSRRQNIAILAVSLLCVLSTLFFWRPGQEMLPYHKGDDYGGAGPYVLTFDAFQKKQVHLDLEADPDLETLDNVYDNTERRHAEVDARWDLAYKDGKYYSYFGITPVLMLYYPCYLFSGKLPTEAMTIDFYATIAAMLLCLVIVTAVRLLEAKPNFLLLLLSLPTAVACASIYICLQYTDKYYVAVSCGMCFQLLSIWLGLLGCSVQKLGARLGLFAGSGLALALCAGARPTMAVSAAILLPFFFGILLRKEEKLRFVQAACFLAPLGLGICGLMLYNKARFGSLTDFGAAYQLTVSDVHANHLRADLLPAAIRHYFLQAPIPRTTFPYMEAINSSLRCYGRYVYTDATFGALSLPMILLGAIFLPNALRSAKPSPGATVLQRRAVMAVCFLVPVLLAWMDFCMGGVNQRYVCDIMPLLTIGSVLVLLHVTEAEKAPYRACIMAVACVLSMGMMLLLMVELRDCSLLQRCPEAYDLLEEALVFWK